MGKEKWTFQTAIYLVIINPKGNMTATGYQPNEKTTQGFMRNVVPWYIFSKAPAVSFLFLLFTYLLT
jgi:hypothetical protein